MIACRRARADELPRLAAFARGVYERDVAPTESVEGRATYARYADGDAMAARAANHDAWVAESEGATIGMLEVRDGTHVAMLFVDAAWQRRGVGRALLGAAFGDDPSRWPALTVNSTPSAVGAYARVGFAPSAPEQETNGLRYQPMARAAGGGSPG